MVAGVCSFRIELECHNANSIKLEEQIDSHYEVIRKLGSSKVHSFIEISKYVSNLFLGNFINRID